MSDATTEYTALHDRLVAASRGHSLSSDRALMGQAAAAIEELLAAAPTYRFDLSQNVKPIPAAFVRALVSETADEFTLLLSQAQHVTLEGLELAPLVQPVVEAVLRGLGLKVEVETPEAPAMPPEPTLVTTTDDGGMILDDEPPATTDGPAEKAAEPEPVAEEKTAKTKK